jgi:hypothetical protein
MKLRLMTDPKKDYGTADQRREGRNGVAIFVQPWQRGSHFIAICRFNPMPGDAPAVTVAYDSDGDLAGAINSRAILGGLHQHYGRIRIFGPHRCSAMRRLLYPPITVQSFGLFQSARLRVS